MVTVITNADLDQALQISIQDSDPVESFIRLKSLYQN